MKTHLYLQRLLVESQKQSDCIWEKRETLIWDMYEVYSTLFHLSWILYLIFVIIYHIFNFDLKKILPKKLSGKVNEIE